MGGDDRAVVLWALLLLHRTETPCSDFLILTDWDTDSGNRLYKRISWIGMLGCTLAKYLYDKSNGIVLDAHDHPLRRGGVRKVDGTINDGLIETIIKAQESFGYDPTMGRDFFRRGTVDLYAYRALVADEFVEFEIFRESNGFDPVSAIKVLLDELSVQFAEANYLLGLAGDRTSERLIRASDQEFLLASYHLGFCEFIDQPVEAIEHLSRFFVWSGPQQEKEFLEFADCRVHAHDRIVEITKEYEQQKMQANLRIQEEKVRSDTIENMMAMFAHKFRGPVDSVIFSADHGMDPLLLGNVGRTMNGLLDVFSYISTSSVELRPKIANDRFGDVTLNQLVCKSLWLAIVQLLPKRKIDVMSAHYYSYCKRTGLIDKHISYEQWSDDSKFLPIQKQLSEKWEEDVCGVTDNATDEQVIEWCRTHLFSIRCIGVKEAKLRCKSFGPKESVFLIVLTEMFVNAIKHYDIESSQPLEIEFLENNGWSELSCKNPSCFESRSRSRGSGKGQQFLRLIAGKLGGEFISPDTSNFATARFLIPSNLISADAS